MALAGIAVPERGDLVSCPHADHPDRNPSCMVYPDPGAGWFCFSCGAGGGPVDLVSALGGGPTGRELRGNEFKRAARECRARLGLEPGPDEGRRSRRLAMEQVRT